MKRLFLALTLCLFVSHPVFAADGYEQKMEQMLSIPAEEKVIEIDDSIKVNDNTGSLVEELGISKSEETKALKDEDFADQIMQEYGYEKQKDGTYETKFYQKRLIVKGRIDGAAYKNGYSIIQYDTPEDAAIAYQKFLADGKEVIIDEKITLELFGDGSIMHLDQRKKDSGTNLTVAVLDSGVNKKVLGARCLDGINAIDGSSDISDEQDHGTAVASVVLNNSGSNVSVLPVKVISDDQESTITAVSYGLTYAAEHADIINMSFGYVAENASTMRFWNSGLKAAIAKDIPVIVSSGNNGAHTDNAYPACYGPCWTIGAVNAKKEVTSFSNYGNIDFVSLGYEVDGIDANGDGVLANGTSFSAPLISALTAEIKASGIDGINGIFNYIKDMCEDLGDPGYDEEYGYGLPVWHKYEEIKAATSTEEGLEKCLWCDASKSIPMLTHVHEWNDAVVTKQPSCVEEGVKTYTCKSCPETKEETISKTAHDYSSSVINPTCISQGYTEHICKNCKTSYKDSYTNVTGHDYKNVVTEPTCISKGYTEHICKNCKHSYKDNYTNNTGHNYSSVKITRNPTCTTCGEKTYTCDKCGNQKKELISDASAHSYSEWTIKEEPTVLKAGSKQHTCNICGNTETKSVAKLPATISVNYKSIPLAVKQSTTAVKVTYGKGDGIKSWKSSNTKVASINKSGKITGKKAGTAKITVTLKSGKKTSVTVKVQKSAVKTSKVNVNSKSVTLKKGKSFQIKATVSPVTSKQKINYTSSNKKVATVNAKGKITAKKKGTATIKVTSGKKAAKIKVFVA